MEYSTNFGFALPSRDNDVDLADINEIANNFRKIDENAVIKEDGKGLSTNDFTNEEKEKVDKSLTVENIDQTYSATSENAQSGVAVAEAIEQTQNIYANALKGYASGSSIALNDVSPLEHKVKVKVEGKNLIPFVGSYNNGKYVSGETYVINGVSFTVNDDGSVYAVGTATNSAVFVLSDSITLGTNPYTLTLSGCPNNIKNCYLALVIDKTSTKTYYDYGDGITIENITVENDRVSFVVVSGATIDAIFYPQLEYGTIATEYEQYIDPSTVTVTEEVSGQTYIPQADGVCEIDSVSPEMKISTDNANVIVKVEYNIETSKAIQNCINEQGKLIYSTTLTEDVKSITISSDNENNNFELSEIYVTLFIPASPSLANFAYVSLVGRTIANIISTPFHNDTVIGGGTEGRNHIVQIKGKINNGRWEFQSISNKNIGLTPSGKFDNAGYVKFSKQLSFDELKFTSIIISPTSNVAVIPTGTIIEVYGK